MKFAAGFVSFALCLATFAEGHAHIGGHHRRSGASPTFSSSTPVSTDIPSLPTSSAAKRGISYNSVKAASAFSNAHWVYNWASEPSGTIQGVEYVPMLWGTGQDHTQNWVDDATAAIASGSTHLLGFNEPDLGAQSNLSPEAAAAAWKTYMEPFAGKAKLVSPAVTNGAAPMGTAWLDQFFAACTGCHIDAVAIHIYDSATNVVYFQNYISDVATKYKLPVWVTEFGGSGSTQQQQTFLQTLIPFLEGLEGVERYAMFFADSLVNSNDQLTAVGLTYNTL